MSKKYNLLWVVLAVALLAIFAAGCGGQATPTAAPTEAPAVQPTQPPEVEEPTEEPVDPAHQNASPIVK